MVWIHGGGFTNGTTSEPVFDGKRFAQQGVVLVSIAYRLGVFGFLAHPQLTQEGGAGPGVYGLQDQIMALQWVRDNIAQFGGDPSRVTIFGESAGGTAVNLLAASPAARGLFARVIAESGGVFSPPRTSDDPMPGGRLRSRTLAETTGREFFRTLGVKDLAAARAAPAAAILKAAASLEFLPALDADVLPAPNAELYARGRFNDTPVLLGFNSDEGSTVRASNVTPSTFTDLSRAFACPDELLPILNTYPHTNNSAAIRALKDINRDSGYGWNTWKWAHLQSQAGHNKVFAYYFDIRNADMPEGAPHGAELPYVFANFDSTPRKDDVAASDLIRKYWIQFATSGDPNLPGLPTWPAFNDTNPQALVFDQNPSARPLPNLDHMKALDVWLACVQGGSVQSQGPALRP